MYNGWTNWETWNAALWLGGLEGFSAGELKEVVVELFSAIPEAGLARDLVNGSIHKINFDEIARAFEPEAEEDEDDFPIDE